MAAPRTRKPVRPTELRIGWATWTVHYLSREQWEADPALNDDNGGETHPADHTIWVVDEHPSGKLNELAIGEVLVHECLHAIFHLTYTGYSVVSRMKREELEEAIVGATSGPLVALLRDNPKLVKYLQEA